MNLLEEALGSNVAHFAFIHVVHAKRMHQAPLVAAKSAFARKLQTAAIQSTIIPPTGYFSDMGDVLNLAKAGPAQFLLTAGAINMAAPQTGTRFLAEHFKTRAKRSQ